MIPVALLGTGSVLPGRTVTSAEVAALAEPPLDPAHIRRRAGIDTRNWVEPGTRFAPVATVALRRALSAAGLAASDLSRIIFASSSGGDWLTPSTASRIAHELALTGQCDCFDINNACVGFLNGVDLAARSIATGMGPIAVVAVEIFKDIIVPDEPRCFSIFGDAGGAVVMGPATADEGVLGVCLKTDPRPGLTAFVEHPRWSGSSQPIRFGITGRDMAEGAVALIVDAARQALDDADLHMDDVDWVLPHQPNGRMFDAIIEALGAPAERTVKVVDRIGSSGAASIPYSLDQLVAGGRVKAGDTLLMVTVGAGASYGAMVLRVGAGLGASRTAGSTGTG